jgi:hypothetical protein
MSSDNLLTVRHQLAFKRADGIDPDPFKSPPRSHQTPRPPSSSSENSNTPPLPSDLSDGSKERGLFGEHELDRAQDPPLQCQHRPLHARLVGALPVQYVDALPYLVHPPVSHRVLSE